MSLSPSGWLGSTGILRNALRRDWTLEVGASVVMGKSRDGEVLVAKISWVMKAKNVEELACT